jgi:hypothetical protein
MRTIKLMADYYSYPLWEASPGKVGNVSPRALPISEDLCQAIFAWAAQYDATLDLAEPSDAGFFSQSDVDRFRATGNELAIKLQNELGTEFKVITNIVAGCKVSEKEALERCLRVSD